tara:strand:- start:2706 stop:3305 length:600 start_codon:yes stop_codon:yes gene_type:complete
VINVFVPIKSFKTSKQRLSQVLSDNSRESLSESLVTNLINKLITFPNNFMIYIVTDDRRISFKDVTSIITKKSLNKALQDSINKVCNDQDEVLIIHSDLPSINISDIEHIIKLFKDSENFIIPDRHNSGTNCLGLRWYQDIQLQFGNNSYKKFIDLFHNDGINIKTINNKNIAFDLDTPEDLNFLTKDQFKKLNLSYDN